MMVLLAGHSLTAADRFQAEKLSVDLSERASTASVTVGDEAPAVAVGDWMMIEDGPGSGIVWRVRTVDAQIEKKTRTIELEHIINSLRDSLMFGEIKPADISGGSGDPTARQAAGFIIARQSDWTLGDVDYSESHPYSFNGDDLFTGMEIVTSALEDAIWEYDMSVYPFVLHIRRPDTAVASEMRTDRNISSLKRTIDRNGMFTRLYPIGKNNLHISGDYVSLNEGIYGVISRTETDQSQDTDAGLRAWATARVRRHAEPLVTVTISGLDLAKTTGEPLDGFTIGKLCRVPLPEYNTIITERVVGLKYPDALFQPDIVTVTLANEIRDVATILRQQQTASGRAGRAGLLTDQGIFHEIYDETGMLHSSILMTASVLRTEFDDAISDVHSSIEQTAGQIRSEVYAANSQIYSAITQTASYIRSEIADTEQGLYNYVNQTASGTHRIIMNSTSRTWIQDKDPTTSEGGSHSPKEGDVWVESTHHGTWDGAEGFDWEHDEEYDWTQVQGAKIWGWANDKWELVSDQQQTVSYSEVIDVADYYVQQRFKQIVDDDGNISIYTAKLQETARSIRAEVSAANSTIYSSIVATATNILLRAKERPRVTYSKTQPTDLDGRGLKEEDVWIQTENQKNWDAAFNFSWDDDSGIDWNALRSDKIKVYKDGDWVDVLDGTTLVEESDVDIDRKRTKIYAKKLEKVDGQLQAYYAELQVDAKQIKSTVDERYNQLGSSITQTAREIRSEVHAANSQVYSSITQTASHIRSEVANEITGVRSSIQQTAGQIRSDVSAANSTIYSRITQTANSIRSEVANEVRGVNSKIEQTATSIRSEVTNNISGINSKIEQTASSIRSEVASSISGVSSQITQTANSIRSDVNAANSAIYSSIQQTASGIRSEVADSISGVRSEITQTASSWSAKINGVVDANGNVTAASIAVAINQSTGESEAKIDAQRVYIGNQKSTTVIAGKATLSDVTADYIKTQIASLAEVVMLSGNVTGQLRIRNGAGQQQNVDAAIWDLWIEQNGNTYTLKRKRISDGDWVEVGSFSRATSLSGAWGSGQLTVTASPQGTTWSCGIGARFTSGGGGYYIEAYRNESGSVASIPDTSTQISLARSGATVMVVDRNGHQIGNTPTLTMTTHNKCKANLIGEVKIGGQRGKVKMYYKDGTNYKEVFSSSYYWYYSDSYADLATYYS